MTRIPILVAGIVALALAAGCGGRDPAKSGPVRLGYGGGPHAAAVYLAEAQAARDGGVPVFTGVPFNSSGDIGYA
jgi:ABC-type nitrate/sulfonate/bicarbonate transport system substrate-binding protein